MSGSKSKVKGSAYERDLSKYFSDIFGGSFVRSAGSGAYIGGSNNIRMANLSEGQIRGFKGDIIPPDFMPLFVVEAKFYKEFPFHQLIQGEEIPLLNSWIEQAQDATVPSDVWFLCFKINRKGEYVLFPKDYPLDLTSIANICYKEEYIIANLKKVFELNAQKILQETSHETNTTSFT